MSGARRRTKYRKAVSQDAELSIIEPNEGEVIVKAVCSRGGNLFEVLAPDGETSLAILPTKFRKLIWIKRGMFLICTCSDSKLKTITGESGKVNMMISHVLMPEQEKNLRKTAHWPEAFADKSSATEEKAKETSSNDTFPYGGYDSDNSNDSMCGVFKNSNRRGMTDSEYSSDSDEGHR